MSPAEPPAPRATSRAALALLVLAAAALCAHSLAFNFVTDDAFISFVYARNLVEHGALVFNLGERVEGYTNFLWTVLLALGMALRVPPELSSRVLGTACAVGTLLVTARLSRRLRGEGGSAWDALPALLLAGVPGYACWSSGGLETQLFTLLVTAGAARYLEAKGAPDAGVGLLFGLSALTRPEGLLFFALTAAHHAALRLQKDGARGLVPTGGALRAAGAFLLLVAPHLLWRRWYYGYWVPNTFYVKSAGLPGTWAQGGYFLLQFALQTKLAVLPVLVVAVVLATRDAALRAAAVYGYVLTAVFLLYVASVGGDFMGLHRFLMPVVPLNVTLGGVALWRALRARPVGVALPLVIGLLGLHAGNAVVVDKRALTFLGADHGIDTPGYLRHYTRDRAAIGRWLGQHVKPDDYQVVGGAGAQVYYAGIRALDSFGLSDEYVAHKVPPRDIRPGHQKFAPLDYVLSRKPTILTYNVYRFGNAPYRPDAAEAALWRSRGFHYVSVQVPGLSSPWYSFLKRTDRTLGPLPMDQGD